MYSTKRYSDKTFRGGLNESRGQVGLSSDATTTMTVPSHKFNLKQYGLRIQIMHPNHFFAMYSSSETTSIENLKMVINFFNESGTHLFHFCILPRGLKIYCYDYKDQEKPYRKDYCIFSMYY